MATVKKELKDILDKYGIDPKDTNKLWDCHGTLVLYHKAYEVIAAKENITFDAPAIIETSAEKRIACICVTGHMGDRSEWSFGEATTLNNKNSYPLAMAEKRAKDRVIAKLVGLAQYVYSEDEADDFKHGEKGAVEIEDKFTKEQKSLQSVLFTRLGQCMDEGAVVSFMDQYTKEIESLPEQMSSVLNDGIENRLAAMKSGVVMKEADSHAFAGVDDAIKWCAKMFPLIQTFKSLKVLDMWENENRPFINGLDCLKADKYKKDEAGNQSKTGKSPKERLLDALMQKRVELENINTSLTPIG